MVYGQGQAPYLMGLCALRAPRYVLRQMRVQLCLEPITLSDDLLLCGENADALRYDDPFADSLVFLEPRLTRARELLAPHGTLYFHIDYREVHYCKLLLD